MLEYEIMHPNSHWNQKTKSSVIRSQRCTSNQVKLFFEPCIAFFVHIWFLCFQSMWHQLGIPTWRGWAGSSALYIIKLCDGHLRTYKLRILSRAMHAEVQSNPVITNSTGPCKYVRYNREMLWPWSKNYLYKLVYVIWLNKRDKHARFLN